MAKSERKVHTRNTTLGADFSSSWPLSMPPLSFLQLEMNKNAFQVFLVHFCNQLRNNTIVCWRLYTSYTFSYLYMV